MGEGTIRAYAPQDLGQVLDIWEGASRVAHPFLPESFVVAEREKVKDVYMPTAASWVWEEDDAVVGFISLIGDEVGALFVDPKNHRRGIGRALLEFVLHEHLTLELEVFAENVGAKSFYERCGFVSISERGHVDSGRQMLRMRHQPKHQPRTPRSTVS
jgi:putative acetyltransferase